MHAAVLAPERVERRLLRPLLPGAPAPGGREPLGPLAELPRRGASAGVELSDEHWYDLGRFFDQVIHLDGERLLQFRQAVGLPALNRLLRLGKTTCGDDSKAVAGLTADLIAGVAQPALALFGEHSPFLATASTWSSTCPTAAARSSPAPSTGPPRRTPRRSSDCSSSSSIRCTSRTFARRASPIIR